MKRSQGPPEPQALPSPPACDAEDFSPLLERMLGTGREEVPLASETQTPELEVTLSGGVPSPGALLNSFWSFKNSVSPPLPLDPAAQA